MTDGTGGVLPELRPGDRLGRYELACIIAQGGMGAIWVGRMSGQHGFERLVALKTILPLYSEDDRFRAMFLDETRIASRIEHPNVLSLRDVGEENGHLYFAMDYVEGETLSRLYRAARKQGIAFPIPLALRIVADACAGIHAAHELRDEDGTPLDVVHRDLSPQNLLVSSRGEVRVIDFGVARARDRMTQATESGTLKGKISYMPREQAMGLAIDRRADVYALGAVLYFLVTGNAPYESSRSTEVTVLQSLLLGEMPELPATGIPDKVRAVITKALAPMPEERFGSALEMKHALEDAILPDRISREDVEAMVERLAGDRIRESRAAIRRAVAASKAGRSEPALPEAVPSHPSMTVAGTSMETLAEAPKTKPFPRAFLGLAALGLVAIGAFASTVFRGRPPPTGAVESARESVPEEPPAAPRAIASVPKVYRNVLPETDDPAQADSTNVPAPRASARGITAKPKSPGKVAKPKTEKIDDGF